MSQKYDFYFSKKQKREVEKYAIRDDYAKMFWRDEEFTLMVNHGEEFPDAYGDYEYVGTGVEDEVWTEPV